MVPLRAGSDLLLHLGAAAHFDEGFVHQGVFLELFDVFTRHLVILFQLLEQVLVLLLGFSEQL